MPDVTPNFTGQSSNVTNGTNQSLQQAAMGVQQGGAASAQIIAQLGQSLSRLNSTVMQSFQKQQKSNTDQQAQTIKAVGLAMETMAGSITKNADRRKDLADAQTLQKSGRSLADASQVENERRETTKQLTMAANERDRNASLTKVIPNFQAAQAMAKQAARVKGEIEASRVALQDPNLDPTARQLIEAMSQSVRGQDDAWEELPEGLQSLYEAYAGESDKWHADRNLAAQTGGAFTTPKPKAPAFNVPKGFMATPELTKALEDYQRARLPSPQTDLDPDAKMMGPRDAYSFPDLGVVMRSLNDDMLYASAKTAKDKQMMLTQVNENAIKTAKIIREDDERLERSTNNQWPVHETATRRGFMKAATDPANYADIDGVKVMRGEVMFSGALQEAYPKDPDVAASIRKMNDGEPLTPSQDNKYHWENYAIFSANYARAGQKIKERLGTDKDLQAQFKKAGVSIPTLENAIDQQIGWAQGFEDRLSLQPGWSEYQSAKRYNKLTLDHGAQYMQSLGLDAVSGKMESYKYTPPTVPPKTSFYKEKLGPDKWKGVTRALGEGKSSPRNEFLSKVGRVSVWVPGVGVGSKPTAPSWTSRDLLMGVGPEASNPNQPPPGQPPQPPGGQPPQGQPPQGQQVPPPQGGGALNQGF